MSWRVVVITSRVKLDLQLGYMVVRGETTSKIHLSEISIIMVESTAVSLTAALLAELVKEKIKVIILLSKGLETLFIIIFHEFFIEIIILYKI